MTQFLVVFLWLSGLAGGAESQLVRAALQPAGSRKAAPQFALQDADRKTVSLNSYLGKVVLLDFWATWCTGCKKEIPCFVEFQKTYEPKGFAVVGLSVDDDGWKVLIPFLSEHQVPYRMLLGNQSTMRLFGLSGLPDTFLIDRKGRIAAAYQGGLVDRANVETNIKILLASGR